jgi:hypothetical protein
MNISTDLHVARDQSDTAMPSLIGRAGIAITADMVAENTLPLLATDLQELGPDSQHLESPLHLHGGIVRLVLEPETQQLDTAALQAQEPKSRHSQTNQRKKFRENPNDQIRTATAKEEISHLHQIAAPDATRTTPIRADHSATSHQDLDGSAAATKATHHAPADPTPKHLPGTKTAHAREQLASSSANSSSVIQPQHQQHQTHPFTDPLLHPHHEQSRVILILIPHRISDGKAIVAGVQVVDRVVAGVGLSALGLTVALVCTGLMDGVVRGIRQRRRDTRLLLFLRIMCLKGGCQFMNKR